MLRQKGRFSAFIIRLAIVATALSVAAMIMAMAMISGFKYEIRQKLFSYWGHVHITPFSANSSSVISPEPIQFDVAIKNKVRQIEGVQTVAPFVIRPGIINAHQMMEGIQLKGVNAEYDFTSIAAKTLDFSDSSYSKEIILSRTTMNRMNLQPGEDIVMYFLEQGEAFPRIRKMKVAGEYHTGMEDIDKNYAVCDIRLLQRINGWEGNKINGYQVSLTNAALSDTIAAQIFTDIIPQTSRLTTYTMHDIFPAIYDWLDLQDVNALIALVILAFVAIIDLVAALLILIVEQARMVGVLKTLGMGETPLRTIFLYHAIVIGGLGILLGNALGLGLCYFQLKTGFFKLAEATYYMPYVPVRIIWWQPILISLATLVLCILCMWLPTLYIRRIMPAKVLQFK
jgi:lipoprotein-releasing system permease protein